MGGHNLPGTPAAPAQPTPLPAAEARTITFEEWEEACEVHALAQPAEVAPPAIGITLRALP